MLRVFVAATILAFPGSAFATGPNGECTCRYQGGDVIEGQTACIRTATGTTLARCEMVLNNTSWKMLNQPCPSAESVAPEGTLLPSG